MTSIMHFGKSVNSIFSYVANFLKTEIRISNKALLSTAMVYLVLPIVIFFLGWLKILLALPVSAILIFGAYTFVKNESKDKDGLVLSLGSLMFLAVAIFAWVYVSGIGGYWFQREPDWHYRNATLRDLINYSWPVVFPENGYGLVYYHIFWMVPAVFGKLFGWGCANFVLYLWSVIGILLSMLFLAKGTKAVGFKAVFTVIVIFMVWGGVDLIAAAVQDFKGKGVRIALHDFYSIPHPKVWYTGYQFTPNNALIEWVFNQTIVPWVVCGISLNYKKLRHLAFLGLLVLPYAPLPFVGIFVIFLFLGIKEIYDFAKNKNYIELSKNIFSIENLSVIFSVLPIFAFYFSCNSVTTGSDGFGGIGLYVPFSDFDLTRVKVLFLFYVVKIILWAVVIFKENKKDYLFYVGVIPLFFFPLFRIGTSGDFCMRGSIPSLFFLMFFVMRFMLHSKNSTAKTMLVILLTLAGVGRSFDVLNGTKIMQTRKAEGKSYLADNVYSLSTLDVIGLNWIQNYCTTNPSETTFFGKLCRRKSSSAINKDLACIKSIRERKKLILPYGKYAISPASSTQLYLWLGQQKEIASLKSEKCFLQVCNDNDSCRIMVPNTRLSLDIPGNRIDENGTVWTWTVNSAAAQKFHFEQIGDFYKIRIREYALAYDETGRVYLEKSSDNPNQLWSITYE